MLSGCTYFKSWLPKGKTYVVIGACAAGTSAAQELARCCSSLDTIIWISKDPDALYDRTKLKRYMATSEIPRVVLSEECINHMPIMRIATIEYINRDEKKIICADGTSIAYDYLFLGIGTEPTIPDIAGMQKGKAGVFGYYTLDDVRTIKDYVKTHPVRTVVVIGGGLAALEMTSLLAAQGYCVHHCVRGSRVLAAKADEGGACCIQQLFSDHGVQWHFNTLVTQLHDTDGKLTSVVLNNDCELSADMVIYAIGGAVSSALTDALEMHCGSIKVDTCMRTSDPYLYAGGDAACVWDYVNATFIRSEKWNAAEKQGICAARNMCNGYQNKRYHGSALVHSACYFNTTIALSGPMGNPPADYSYTVDTENGYRAFLTKDGQLKGFCLVGVSRSEVKKYSAILKNDN